MVERRQAHRKEPIEVEVRKKVLEAHPLPWLDRNDIGNAIMRQYAEILNSTMRSYTNPETGTPELEMFLNDKLKDPVEIVVLGYPQYKDNQEELAWLNKLDYSELLELIYAVLDVNQLESLRDFVDPNSITPEKTGGNDSPGVEVDTPSPQLSADSASQGLEEPTSSSSPTERSSTSSESKSENSGMSDGGSSL